MRDKGYYQAKDACDQEVQQVKSHFKAMQDEL
jgi:spore coat protein CotF